MSLLDTPALSPLSLTLPYQMAFHFQIHSHIYSLIPIQQNIWEILLYYPILKLVVKGLESQSSIIHNTHQFQWKFLVPSNQPTLHPRCIQVITHLLNLIHIIPFRMSGKNLNTYPIPRNPKNGFRLSPPNSIVSKHYSLNLSVISLRNL
ncbi:hypothetical protein SAMN05444416_1235 [Thermoactinomyces sp. DSM 45892]|nr:hypothetical protein SAMN05444416_1235 [Thermoactinomyces sp. DSM 45892]